MTVGRPSIDSYIKNLTYDNNDNPLNAILGVLVGDSTVSKVSFWGTRVISVAEYSGTIAITEIYAKAIALSADVRSKNIANVAGTEALIICCFKQHNDAANEAAKTANFFTRFLVFVRDWFSPVKIYDER